MPHRFVESSLGSRRLPGHNPGLVLQRLAPPLSPQRYADFVRALASASLGGGYRDAFRRWQRRTPPAEGRRVLRLRSAAPVAVGLGEPVPGENGLTTSYPWGAPMIPGSALKGVVRASCLARFGVDPQWGRAGTDLGTLLGTGGDKGEAGAVDFLDELDGPRADGGDVDDKGEAGAVDFLDAWIEPEGRFVHDVITPHHAGYYQGKGPPNGFEGPNPITFAAAEGVFRIVLEGPEIWLDRAEELLVAALETFGVGAKTRAGYGRLVRIDLDDADAAALDRNRPAAARLEGVLEHYAQRAQELQQALELLVMGDSDRVGIPELRPLPEGLFDIAAPDVQRVLDVHLRPGLQKRARRGSERAQTVLDILDSWGHGASSRDAGQEEATQSDRRLAPSDLELSKKERRSERHRDRKIRGLERRLCAGGYALEDVTAALDALESWGAKDGTLAAVRRAYGLEA